MSAIVRRLLMPKLGLTMTEGTVVEWPVEEGGSFAGGDTLVVVETDKVANEVAAPSAGRLRRRLVAVGETVPIGTVLAEWEAHAQAEAAVLPAASVLASHAPSAAATQRRAASPRELLAARRMIQAKQEIPHFYLSTEVDVGRLQQLRSEWNSDSHRARVTVTHLFVIALARALAQDRELNRVWDGDGFQALPSIDIGIAVDTQDGLRVPMLRFADKANLEEIIRKANDLIERARNATLAPEDVGGGVITISNAGIFGVTYMMSIINPGQAAILGVGGERRNFRPDAEGKPRLAREIGVTLSCDHRVLDGASGLRLLNSLRRLLEAPEPLFA